VSIFTAKTVTNYERKVEMDTTIKTVNRLLGLLMIVGLVNMVTIFKLQSTTNAGGILEIVREHKSYVSANNVDRTLECLAMNIYKEAGNESFEGKVAVAQVTLNRVDHPKFPKDICGVVYQKNVIMEKVVCQFSWYCDSVHKARPVNKESYADSYAVAKKVLLEGFRLDSLTDAIYYHADYVNPRWPHERITKVGAHIFYRSRT
jgi:spore germination cell wall hydrolase CwlJ-like protein